MPKEKQDVRQLLDAYSDVNGWSDEVALGILLEYIKLQDDDEAFEAFLKQKEEE